MNLRNYLTVVQDYYKREPSQEKSLWELSFDPREFHSWVREKYNVYRVDHTEIINSADFSYRPAWDFFFHDEEYASFFALKFIHNQIFTLDTDS